MIPPITLPNQENFSLNNLISPGSSTSLQKPTFKKLNKAKFGITSLPTLTQISSNSSLSHLKKMPKIVRKILEQKRHFDPKLIESLDDQKDKRVILQTLLFRGF
jgi:hypothetical protein